MLILISKINKEKIKLRSLKLLPWLFDPNCSESSTFRFDFEKDFEESCTFDFGRKYFISPKIWIPEWNGMDGRP